MKKIFLFPLLFLSACSSNGNMFCPSYINESNQIKTTLYILKNGSLKKEIKNNDITSVENGLYTVENNTLNTFIKNEKAHFFITDNHDTLIEKTTNRKYECD